MFDWLWWFWSPWSVYLYLNGALWVTISVLDRPTYLKERKCRWCDHVMVVLWPFVLPSSFAIAAFIWLKTKLGRNRTYI
jgi:hypothetical protein